MACRWFCRGVEYPAFAMLLQVNYDPFDRVLRFNQGEMTQSKLAGKLG